MSLPYLFPFWFVAEQKHKEVSHEVTVSLAILNLAELNLHPRPCPDIAYFCAESGR